MGAFACLARLSAKTIVVIVSLLILAIALSVLAFGVLSLSAFHATFLSGAIPAWASATVIVIGVFLLIFALGGIFGTACCLHKSKKFMCPIATLTVIMLAFTATVSVAAFRAEAVIQLASETGFDDSVDAAVKEMYVGLRNAYVNAYVKCNATSYFTDNVKGACQTQAAFGTFNALNVSACADASYGAPGGYVGTYCRNGPGLEPFSVDRALAFPDKSAPFDPVSLLAQPSFGYFLSSTCMPTADRYWELMSELVEMNIPQVLIPPARRSQVGTSNFGKCYAASWWGESTAGLAPEVAAAIVSPPSIPNGFTRDPATGEPLTGQRKTFFDGLQLSRTLVLGNPYASARLSFCFCAEQGAASPFFKFLKETIFANAQYVALGLAIFFGLALVSEIYLACCVANPLKETGNPQQLTLRGWSAGSQPVFLSHKDLARP